MEHDNTVKISGTVIKVYPLKYTLSGIAVLSYVLEHCSTQVEAGMARHVRCRVYCTMLGADQSLVSSLDRNRVEVVGFLSQNAKSQIVLHVKKISYLK